MCGSCECDESACGPACECDRDSDCPSGYDCDGCDCYPDCGQENRCRGGDVWRYDTCGGGWLFEVQDCGSSSGWGAWYCRDDFTKERSRTIAGCSGGSCTTSTSRDTVACSYGCSAGKCQPHAAFSMAPNPAGANDTITLDASASRDSYGGTDLTYDWYYDDQGIASGKTVQYDLSTGSIHEVRLEVKSAGMVIHPEDNGTTNNRAQNLTVDEAPVPVINAPDQCIVPCAGVNINAVGTADGVDPPEALTYEWDYESNGSVDETFNDPNEPGEHLFGTVTTYTMTLKVTNTGGQWAETTKDIDVINNDPIADFRLIPFPSSGIIPLTILFVNQSTDPDGHLMTYLWEFGPGQGTSTGLDTEHVYSVSDQYDIKLTVTDEYGGVGTKSGMVDAMEPAAIVHFSATDLEDVEDSTIVEIFCNKKVDAQLQILTVEGEPVLDKTGQPIDGLMAQNFECTEDPYAFPVPEAGKDGFPEQGVYQLVATIKNEICTNCPKVIFIVIEEEEQVAETPEIHLALVVAVGFAVLLIAGRKEKRK